MELGLQEINFATSKETHNLCARYAPSRYNAFPTPVF